MTIEERLKKVERELALIRRREKTMIHFLLCMTAG